MCEPVASKIYVSCIKVKGIHLLPPVITDQRRIELQKYKKDAIKLEKRLQNCRELKKNLQDLLNYQPLSDRPESEITFRDNTHIESLGISDEIPPERVSKRKVSLSRDIIDVTEYSNDGIRVIDNEAYINHSTLKEGQLCNLNSSNEAYETDTSLNRTTEITSSPPSINQEPINRLSDIQSCNLDLSELEIDTSNFSTERSVRTHRDSENDVSATALSTESPKPRLIRSNSYTLENPSPVLLAHMEKAKNEQSSNLIFNTNWCSPENNYVPFEKSEFSSINTVCHNEENPPVIEVIHTDISVQQIKVNGENEKNMPFDLSDPNSQLMQVLKNLPLDYSQKIIELIETRKAESCAEVEHVNRINSQLSESTIDHNYRDVPSLMLTPPSESLRRILYTEQLKPSTPLNLVDLETEPDESCRSSSRMDDGKRTDVIWQSGPRKINAIVNDGLVPDLDAATLKKLKREWAARVIGAHVKGYLTRRLLRTEKVQSLIETIKDALLCALQLHTAENIDESDVELHRRLINQVSAACYAFHDIFFSLSTRDQMALISLDRQRKIEKSKRSLSAVTPRSTRSFSRQSSGRRVKRNSHSATKI